MTKKWNVFEELQGVRSESGEPAYEPKGCFYTLGITKALGADPWAEALFATSWVLSTALRSLTRVVATLVIVFILLTSGASLMGGMQSFMTDFSFAGDIPTAREVQRTVLQLITGVMLVKLLFDNITIIENVTGWATETVLKPASGDSGSWLGYRFAHFGVCCISAHLLLIPATIILGVLYVLLLPAWTLVPSAIHDLIQNVFAALFVLSISGAPFVALLAASHSVGLQSTKDDREFPVRLAILALCLLLVATIIGLFAPPRSLAAFLGLTTAELALFCSMMIVSFLYYLLATGEHRLFGAAPMFALTLGVAWLLARLAPGTTIQKLAIAGSGAYPFSLLASTFLWKARYAAAEKMIRRKITL